MTLRVCIHGQNYHGASPVSDLPDCVLDAERERDWYVAHRAEIEAIYGGLDLVLQVERTAAELEDDLVSLAEATGVEDEWRHFYSGHGSNVYRPSSEEGDHKDEALVGYDGQLLLDDAYADTLRRALGPGWATLDSCFGGGMNRAATAIPRFWASEESAPPEIDVPTYGRIAQPRARKGVFSGGGEGQVTYSTGSGGVFSLARLRTWSPGMTWRQHLAAIVPSELPSHSYPMRPRLLGGKGRRDTLVLV